MLSYLAQLSEIIFSRAFLVDLSRIFHGAYSRVRAAVETAWDSGELPTLTTDHSSTSVLRGFHGSRSRVFPFTKGIILGTSQIPQPELQTHPSCPPPCGSGRALAPGPGIRVGNAGRMSLSHPQRAPSSPAAASRPPGASFATEGALEPSRAGVLLHRGVPIRVSSGLVSSSPHPTAPPQPAGAVPWKPKHSRLGALGPQSHRSAQPSTVGGPPSPPWCPAPHWTWLPINPCFLPLPLLGPREGRLCPSRLHPAPGTCSAHSRTERSCQGGKPSPNPDLRPQLPGPVLRTCPSPPPRDGPTLSASHPVCGDLLGAHPPGQLLFSSPQLPPARPSGLAGGPPPCCLLPAQGGFVHRLPGLRLLQGQEATEAVTPTLWPESPRICNPAFSQSLLTSAGSEEGKGTGEAAEQRALLCAPSSFAASLLSEAWPLPPASAPVSALLSEDTSGEAGELRLLPAGTVVAGAGHSWVPPRTNPALRPVLTPCSRAGAAVSGSGLAAGPLAHPARGEHPAAQAEAQHRVAPADCSHLGRRGGGRRGSAWRGLGHLPGLGCVPAPAVGAGWLLRVNS